MQMREFTVFRQAQAQKLNLTAHHLVKAPSLRNSMVA